MTTRQSLPIDINAQFRRPRKRNNENKQSIFVVEMIYSSKKKDSYYRRMMKNSISSFKFSPEISIFYLKQEIINKVKEYRTI